MGILVKFFIEDSKKQLNVVVENYDSSTKKCSNTLLDVVVPLVARSDHNVSEIDEITKDDLTTDQNNFGWNSANDDLEKVLGEELGIEICNITGNATSSTSNEKKPRTPENISVPAPVNELQAMDEDQILNSPSPEEVGLDRIATDLQEETCEDNVMIVTLNSDFDEDLILNSPERSKNNPEVQHDPVVDDQRPKEVDQSTSYTIVKSDDEDSSQSSKSRMDNKTDNSEPVKKKKSNEPSDKNEFQEDVMDLQEDVMDLDYQEVDHWSVNQDSEDRFVDLTEDRENIDPHFANSRTLNNADESCDEEGSITIVNDLSDDEDEISSQYSSARNAPLRRTKSASVSFSFDHDANIDFHPRRTKSSSSEDILVETIYDDEICGARSDDFSQPHAQVVDLTTDKEVICVDLTYEKKSPVIAAAPTVNRRSMTAVMNDIKNFYKSNKDIIAENRKALVKYEVNTRRAGIEAPPRPNNGLGRSWCVKRCSSECSDNEDDVGGRMPKANHLRILNENTKSTKKPLNKVPEPVCGPTGYHVNDDLSELQNMATWDDRIGNRGDCVTHQKPIPALCEFKRNYRPRPRNSFANGDGFNPHAKTLRNRFFKRQHLPNRFSHMSPLKRPMCAPKSMRHIRPTTRRGAVWLQ